MKLSRSFPQHRLVFTLLCAGWLALNCSAQDLPLQDVESIIDKFDPCYGVDYNLVNGKKYVDFYSRADGNPFFNGKNFEEGWVQIEGRVYKDQLLNYDIYDQDLILEYTSDLIGKQRFIVPKAHLEGFALNDREFAKLKIGELPERIYEIVSGDRYQLVISHDKIYSIDRNAVNWGYRFSEKISKKYMIQDENLVRFRNNRSFRKLFPRDIQNDIKNYMIRYRIDIKQSQILSIKKLMDYINEL